MSPTAVESGPEGLAVNPATGELQWVPERGRAGSHQAELRVTGPGGTAVTPGPISVECPEPKDLRVACGCTGGGEGLLPLALLAWLRRRRASPGGRAG